MAASRALFGQGELRDLDEGTLAAALAEVPAVTLPAARRAGRELPTVADLLAEAGHRAEQVGGPAGHRGGRRVPEQRQGAGRRTSPAQAADLLHGRFLVLRRGKRTIAGVQVGE